MFKNAVINKPKILGGETMGSKPNWTEDEIQYLEEKWGVLSIKTISHNLARTINAVKCKAQKMGLSDPTLHFDGITICQLMKALDKSYNSVYPWINLYDMPVKEKVFCRESRVKVISYKDFWNWAEQHKELLNFAKMERNLLGPEPQWMTEKRKADTSRSQKTWQSVNWTISEDQELRQLVIKSGMTYPKLATYFNRSESAIKRRLLSLNIKFRPEPLDNHIKYTPDDVKKLSLMARQGYSCESIAQTLNKSALGVRGKLERMNFDFKRREFRNVEVPMK